MADLINNLIDFRYTTKMDCITNYLHEHSGRICNRLWISSPFISSEKIFYYIFQISKIKKHKPNFRLLTDLNNISINKKQVTHLRATCHTIIINAKRIKQAHFQLRKLQLMLQLHKVQGIQLISKYY